MLEDCDGPYMAYGVALAVFRTRNIQYKDQEIDKDEQYFVLVGYLKGMLIFNI